MDKAPNHLHLTQRIETGAPFQRRHAHNYYILGRKCVEADDANAARRHFERALRYDPLFPQALQAWASLELSQGNLEIARALAIRAVDADPESPEAYFVLGSIALREQKPVDALAAYQQAAALGMDWPELQFNTGLAHLLAGQAAQAESVLGPLVKREPSHYRAWNALGCARRIQRDNQGAVNAFLRALQCNPQAHDTRDQLARVLLDTGNAREACEMLEFALACEPQRATSRHLLGMAYAALKEYDHAAACWEALIDQQAATAETYHLLANAYIHQENRVRAREVLQILVREYPDHLSGHIQLALLLFEQGEQQQGAYHLDRARSLDPQHPSLQRAITAVELLRDQVTAGKNE